MSNQIKKAHIYLFFGPDTFSIAEKVASWKERFCEKYGVSGIVVVDAEECDPLSLKSSLSSRTLFSRTSLVIVKNVFLKKAGIIQELLCARLPTVSPDTFVVLTDEKRDGKSDLSKLLTQLAKKGVCVLEEFGVPEGLALKKWVSDRAKKCGGSFDSAALAVFTRALEQKGYADDDAAPLSLWHLDNEVRKLVSYAQSRPIAIQDIQAVSCLPVSAHIFDLSDALVAGNEKAALSHAHLLEPLIRTLQFLMTQFRGFLIVKNMEEDAQPDAEIARVLGWNPKRIWVVKKKLGAHSTASLARAYDGLLDLERTIKTGAADPLLTLDLFITAVSRKL